MKLYIRHKVNGLTSGMWTTYAEVLKNYAKEITLAQAEELDEDLKTFDHAHVTLKNGASLNLYKDVPDFNGV